MPRRSKFDFKKKKSYRVRFSDKKINTAIEKKIQAIAKREITKERQYCIHSKNVLATPTSTWDGTFARPLQTAMVELTPNSLLSFLMTDASALSENIGGTNTTRIRSVCHAKTLQANLCFENYSQNNIKVRLAFISVPNTNSVTTAEPQAQDQPYTNILHKGIFKRGLSSYTGSSTRFDPKSRILATKRFNVPPTRALYDVKGSTITDEITLPSKEVSLTKTYKSKGYKLTFNSTNQNRGADDNNVYLCITTNAENVGASIGMRMYGVCGMKFSVEQGTQNTNA